MFLTSNQTLISVEIEKENYFNEQDNSESNNEFLNLHNIDNYSTSDEEPHVESINTLEKCSITYFAGYLAKKCLEKFQCEQCKKYLVTLNDTLDEKDHLLIVHKTFEHME